jgi:DMSO/TMAO reductase YedYZ molybdopterin-dependent catalytic subunit
VPLFHFPRIAWADRGDGLIVRQAEPPNLEFPFASLDTFLTPTERFFVRNHFAVPKLDAAAWRLKVEGAVRQPLEMSYEELRRLPSRTRAATLECAGNGRALLVPRVKGVPWELGAVSTAEWQGVPLGAVLDKAGLRDGVVEVVLEGADEGEIKDEPKPPGKIHFARSVPLGKARTDVILAHQMNGRPLTEEHGFPVRAVVPGWYGVASVKWLTRIVAVDRPFRGFFQTFDYSTFVRRAGQPVVEPITEMQVKAQPARPTRGEVVPAGKEYRVFGAAWAGEAEVARVEVSTDGGFTWDAARLLDPPAPCAWRRWEYAWQVPGQPGKAVLQARATDSRGRTQPAERDPDRRNYMVTHVLPVEVEVR